VATARTDVEVKRRGRVQDDFDAGRLDDLIKGVGLGDVRDDSKGQLLGRLVRVRFPDLLRLVLGPHRRDHIVAFGQELLQDMGCGFESIVSLVVGPRQVYFVSLIVCKLQLPVC